MRGLLDWKAPIWAQIIVSTASLLVAAMRMAGAFRRGSWLDAVILMSAGFIIIFVAYTGLQATREGPGNWGWGAVLGYAVFGAVLISVGLLLAWR